MLDAKFVVRNIGTPNKGLAVYSPDEVSEYLKYQYEGYDLKETHYLGEVKDAQNQVQGWKVMLVLVRGFVPVASVNPPAMAEVGEPTLPELPVVKKPGRPPKGS